MRDMPDCPEYLVTLVRQVVVGTQMWWLVSTLTETVKLILGRKRRFSHTSAQKRGMQEERDLASGY